MLISKVCFENESDNRTLDQVDISESSDVVTESKYKYIISLGGIIIWEVIGLDEEVEEDGRRSLEEKRIEELVAMGEGKLT